MYKIILFYILSVFVFGEAPSEKDLHLKIYDASDMVGMPAKMVEFGGFNTPLCKLAISNDGNYFFLRKVSSNCIKFTNSNGIKIICNSDKSVCKTRGELIDFVRTGQDGTSSKPSWCQSSHLNSTEHTICDNKNLYTLDKRMTQSYGAAEVKDNKQVEWLNNERNRCGTNVGCIQKAYKDRINAIWHKTIEQTDFVNSTHDFLKKECEAGIVLNCRLLAENYHKGKYGSENQAMEAKYLAKACELKDYEACNDAGIIYYKGKRIRKQVIKALPYLRKGCEANYKLSCYYLGLHCVMDEKDIYKAKKYFRKSCDLGDSDGCHLYGVVVKKINEFRQKEEEEEEARQKQEEEDRRSFRRNILGKYVCHKWSNGKNGWCGTVTQALGDSIRIENYRVFCGKGGFLGICTNISGGSCLGNNQLFTEDSGEKYKNPSNIIVPISCVE